MGIISNMCNIFLKYIWKMHWCLPGSGALVAPEAQTCWFGHPAQADAFPASSLLVPGQSKIIKERKKNNIHTKTMWNS